MRLLAVAGAGTMGRGIARLAAQSGLDVSLYDPDPAALARSLSLLASALGEDAGRVKAARSTAELGPADFFIEAAPEDLELKRSLLRELDALARPEAVLATNTSSLSVAAVASACARPERVLGLHFFNPAWAMRLVELVRAPKTAEAALDAARALARELGKSVVEASDTPGFIVNRVLRPFYLEGLRAAGEGLGSFAALDAALRAEGLPMGPFELMDLIGLDVNLAITRRLHEAFGRPARFAPHPIQESLVASGCLGRKSGEGFYLYPGKPRAESPRALRLLPPPRLGAPGAASRVLDAVSEEAERVLAEGVADAPSIDAALRLAANFPFGPLERRRRGA